MIIDAFIAAFAMGAINSIAAAQVVEAAAQPQAPEQSPPEQSQTDDAGTVV